jgi:hypothetical protein
MPQGEIAMLIDASAIIVRELDLAGSLNYQRDSYRQSERNFDLAVRICRSLLRGIPDGQSN